MYYDFSDSVIIFWMVSSFLLCFCIDCVFSKFADNSELQGEWESAKLASKQRLAEYVLKVTGVSIDPKSLFDIQIKRIHEYKRQLMNILYTVYRYKKLKVRQKLCTPKSVLSTNL